MKRILLASLIAAECLTNISTAHASKGNWLAGISGGYAEVSGNLNSSISYIGPIPFLLNVEKDTSFKNDNLMLGAFAGYQLVFKKWLAGLELNADWYDKDTSQNLTLRAFPASPLAGPGISYDGFANYEQDLSIALTARIGYALTCYLIPYFRLGLEGSRDHLEVSYFSPVASNAAFRGSFEASRTSYRFLGGIGFEIPFCNLAPKDPTMRGISVRAEYNYYAHKHSIDGSVLSFDSVDPGLRDEIYTASYKPNCNAGKISFVWNFN